MTEGHGPYLVLHPDSGSMVCRDQDKAGAVKLTGDLTESLLITNYARACEFARSIGKGAVVVQVARII